MEVDLGLNEISKDLAHTHLKIKLDFLKKLLVNASNSEAPFKNKLFVEKLGCYFGDLKRSSPTVYGWTKGYRTMPMNKLLIVMKYSSFSWKDVEKNLINIKAGIRGGEVCLPFPIVLDERMGSIVGHILGDGSIDKANHSVFFSNSNVELIKEFETNMKSVFGSSSRIWVQERRKFTEKTKWLKRVYRLDEIPEKHGVGIFSPKICSDILYSICGKFAEGKIKVITDEIKGAPKKFKRGLIRAFFDDEGSIDDKSHMVRFHQDEEDILKDLSGIIEEFGIRCNPIRFYYKKNKKRHYFNITGFKEYSKFFEVFGCTSSVKRKKFELLINKVKNSKKNKNNKLSRSDYPYTGAK